MGWAALTWTDETTYGRAMYSLLRPLSPRISWVLRPAFIVGLTIVVLLAAARGATADPVLTVTPDTDLSGGDVVHVEGSGLPSGIEARIIQCDVFNDDPSSDCPTIATVLVGTDGTVSTDVTLADPIFRTQPFGDATPVYCRSDTCSLFVVWSDDAQTNVLSQPLEFVGSPATLEVAAVTDLRKNQKVVVTGTAHGAEGQVVQLVEEACFSIIQGSGCYGTFLLGQTVVSSDGTWSLRVRVSRWLADGTDCADPEILGACQLTARVLDASGAPDDTFGIARVGDPGVVVTFRRKS